MEISEIIQRVYLFILIAGVYFGYLDVKDSGYSTKVVIVEYIVAIVSWYCILFILLPF